MTPQEGNASTYDEVDATPLSQYLWLQALDYGIGNKGKAMTGGEKAPRPNWFVGAMHRGGEDQIDRFLSEGIWENRYEDKYLDDVHSMQPGDRIAIKSTCNRKRDLPFDNQGNFVSVMKINAIGTITGNRNDGKCVDVNWITKKKTEREWYFYRCLLTISDLLTWYAELEDFA